MRSNSIFEIHLSSDELLLILSYLNINQTPFFVSLDNSSTTNINGAEKSLAEKNYIKHTTKHKISLDTSVAALIHALTQSRNGIELTKISLDDRPKIHRTYLVANQLILEYEWTSEEDNHVLRAIRNYQTLIERLSQTLNLTKKSIEHSSIAFDLDEEFCLQVPHIFASNGKSAGITYLRNKGLSLDLVEVLTRIFYAPVFQCRLQLVSWSANKVAMLEWIIFVEDIHGLWIFQKSTEDKTSVTITNSGNVTGEKMIRRIIDKLFILEKTSIT